MRRIGIDVGGTNTDAVLLDSGAFVLLTCRAAHRSVHRCRLRDLGCAGHRGHRRTGGRDLR